MVTVVGMESLVVCKTSLNSDHAVLSGYGNAPTMTNTVFSLVPLCIEGVVTPSTLTSWSDPSSTSWSHPSAPQAVKTTLCMHHQYSGSVLLLTAKRVSVRVLPTPAAACC